ncbi:MAG: AAA family ATPase [Nitrospirae bacterium CG_4_10_14_3_um_filter_44_29]|nr:replication-associated recombination protein A [Nitrospirota bacterium]PIP69925.1 MAG: AAA family ATPase [Nitrospirae bacterium CG22_combo_CG10-13_8_21_14_all_44_11]PIV44122.1 MAG: AAA family ATPase [Nitrospirae bacterium CG02_land_8_20_14_3_00_44_33]PIV66418.1 MAG: AAA family ATPase [Nitrospirae bacterium CG01_land_8_20_14_3_00_44_22]PIW89167.1 MAG: AAA family ATPase [Nitrospirae bacterium CG_4_8_14_3_um_filter_44_28]PIX89644.1 MAG: AAA family ATPase [Nitrospirae bacterium CG_4_10_14_3_um_
MSLFNKYENIKDPLAYRMTPKTLDEYAGQEHILGKGKLLRRAIEADRVISLILYGPPGIGKTALAQIIANKTNARFERLNAATVGLDELRRVIKKARDEKKTGTRTILFLDEIHRFNKLQQDALLPDVEEGNITLIAATVENPFFYVNSALLSRSQVFELKPLLTEDILKILNRALTDKERGLGNLNISPEKGSLEHIAKMADGDARKALSALEIAALTTQPDANEKIIITKEIAEESIQKKAVVYDKKGGQHYDTISAFIKSMRGSDPDAAIYYLAKMLYAGEDPRFIARRIVICAAEDVGLKDPMALVLAISALKAIEFVGMPEARIPLAEAVIYIANAPKGNSAYMAIEEAMKDIAEEETMEVPDHLKGSNYSGAKKLGHGIGYKYPHDYPEGKVEQEYLQKKKKYYKP